MASIDYDDPQVWDAHVAIMRAHVPEPVDAVFSSEAYGEELARRLDAVPVCVDLSRERVPCSGTAVRADPAAHWWALSAPVRSWFCRRIVIVGAESTGTTTLAAALADELGTVWVPEFGREWSEVRPGGLAAPWRSEEFDLIAQRQTAMIEAAARRAPVPIVVADTDALATAVWHERYLQTRCSSVEAVAAANPPDLYVLTDCDIPFVQDGLRDGEHVREWMTQRFVEVLSAQPVPWVWAQGPVEERLRTTLAAVQGQASRRPALSHHA